MIQSKKTMSVAVILVALATIALLADCSQEPQQQINGKNILTIVPEGFGINYFLLRDELDRYGYSMTCAGLTDTVTICEPFGAPRGGLPMTVDTLLSQITDISGFDAIVLLTSTQFTDREPFADIMGDDHTMKLIAEAASKDIPIFTSCAGVRVLAALDLVNGKSITGSKRYQQEFEAAGAVFLGVDFAPQIIGNLITSSRGQYNNIPNATAISAVIEDRESDSPHGESSASEFIVASDAGFSGHNIALSKNYGGLSADGASAICTTLDGGFLMVGYTFSHGSDNADILAIKTDSLGDLVWAETYGGSGSDYAGDVLPLEDGFVITGYTTSIGSGEKDVYLLKIDPAGLQLWSHAYGGADWDVGTALCRTDDGGFAIAGYTTSDGSGEEDIYLVKTDAGGEMLWTRTFGGDKTDMSNSIVATPDGGFAIGATTNSFGGGNSDFYLIKTDSSGNEQWAKAYHPTGEHGHGFDWGTSMCASSDGGYFVAGFSDCNDLMDAYVIKVDSEGNQLWANAFGDEFYDYATRVVPISDGGVGVVGVTKAPFNNNDVFIAKLDSNGVVTSRKSTGGDGADWASSFIVSSDSQGIITGQSSPAGTDRPDFMLLKLSLP